MLDELSLAEFVEEITQLKNVIQQRDELISELQESLAGTTTGVDTEKELIVEALRERESELAYLSKELTQREREVGQFKHLAQHLEQKAAGERAAFEEAEVAAHADYERRLQEQRDRAVELGEDLGKLQETIESMQEAERELVESRESLVQEYEAKCEELRLRIEQDEAAEGTAGEVEALLCRAQEEIERLRNGSRELEAQLQRKEAETEELNQFLASTQAEIGRLNSELQTVRGIAKQQRVEMTAQLETEREQRERGEGSHRLEIEKLDGLIQFMQAELEEATEKAERAEEVRAQLVEEDKHRQEREDEFKRQMAALEAQVQGLKGEIEQDVVVATQSEGLRAQLLSAEKARSDLEQEYAQEVEALEGRIGELADELGRKNEDAAEFERLVNIARSEIALLQSKLDETRAAGTETEDELRRECAELNSVHQEWMELTTSHIDELERASKGDAEELERLRGQLEGFEAAQADLEEAQKRIADLETSLGQEENTLSEIVERNMRTQRQLTDRHTALQNARDQIDQLQMALREAETASQGLSARIAVLQQDVERTQEERDAAIAQAKEREEELQTVQERIDKSAALLEATREELSAAVARADVVDGALAQANSALEDATREKAEMERTLTDERKLLEELTERELQQREEIAGLVSRMEESQSQVWTDEAVGALQEQFSEKQAELDESDRLMSELMSAHQAMLEDLSRFQEQNEGLRVEVASRESELQRLAAETIPGLEAERDEFARECTSHRNAVESLSAHRDHLQVELEAANQEAQALQDALSQWQNRAKALRSENEELESVLANERSMAEALIQKERESHLRIDQLQDRLQESEVLLADNERKHLEEVARVEGSLEESQVEAERKDRELLEVIEANCALEEGLRQANDRSEDLDEMVETHRAEIARLAEVELPSLNGELSSIRQERDELNRQCEHFLNENVRLDRRASELEAAVGASRKESEEYAVQLQERESDVERSAQECSAARSMLEIANSDLTRGKQRLERFRVVSAFSHAAVFIVAIALGVFLSPGPSGVQVANTEDVNPDSPSVDRADVGSGVELVSEPAPEADGSDGIAEIESEVRPSQVNASQGQVRAEAAAERHEGGDADEEIPALEGVPNGDSDEPVLPEEPDFAVEEGTGESVQAQVAASEAETASEEPVYYVIKRGDRLINICKKELGDGNLWKDVAKLNKLTERDLKRLRPGNRILLMTRR